MVGTSLTRLAHPAEPRIRLALPRSGYAAAGLKQLCDFGQHADRRFAGDDVLRWDGLGGRRRRAVPYLVLGHGNPYHHGRVLEADAPDRNRLGLALRGSKRRAIGLAGAIDVVCGCGRGDLAKGSEVMA